MKVRAFNVLPKLPKPLEPLRDIAYNIWFSWNWERSSSSSAWTRSIGTRRTRTRR